MIIGDGNDTLIVNQYWQGDEPVRIQDTTGNVKYQYGEVFFVDLF